MRPPGCAPNAIWADANPRESLQARAATTQLPRPVREGRKQGPRNAKQIAQDSLPPAPDVIDDLPDVVPVGSQELDVIETYLRAVLNGLLGARE
jgi:hypothetical protein